MVRIHTYIGLAPDPVLFALWHIALGGRVIFGPGFPLTLPFHYHQLLLGMGRRILPYSSMGLRGFSFIPKLKSGLFFFQKFLCKLVVGSGNEDSHGNLKK